ncbi:hypothetical protein LH431_15295 [Laribacter hongkongensis]|uniref:hypothetical protein n=1 Tax=Laribacter hongkongensis TaxID=168471 RepID=UPI001EFD6BA8|nr:hypothetical protein [Laribacter hongkongensis]MCG9011927.1 hypothetical protein [Laribacter hongkongensis]
MNGLTIDARRLTGHHAPVAVNPATGFGDLSNKADSRLFAAIFASVHRYACVQFMAGDSGETFVSAGSLFRFANPAICLPPPFGDGGQASKNKEAAMPSLSLPVIPALIPLCLSLIPVQPSVRGANAGVAA